MGGGKERVCSIYYVCVSNIRKCFYLYPFVHVLQDSEQTLIHEVTHHLALKHKPPSDTIHYSVVPLLCCNPAAPGQRHRRISMAQEGHRQV